MSNGHPKEIDGRLNLNNINGNKLFNDLQSYLHRMFNEPNLSSGNKDAIRKLRHRGKSRHTKG